MTAVSSRQLAARWSTATGVLMSALLIRRRLFSSPWIACKVAFTKDPPHGKPSTVARYAGERCLPECVIERHSGLTSGVMVLGVISYHGRSNLQRIQRNLTSNRFV
ncbi:hypothetical protein TNCV_2590561 [Trichonephila clavipes]|nr:hypothetical protein TNCV_2590561 [Trichonephila clavipes]